MDINVIVSQMLSDLDHRMIKPVTHTIENIPNIRNKFFISVNANKFKID